ncbi:MAG: PhoH family protein, partial [Betaproteobacteria bacterium]|nr:PhoH family protein [Betaproteobacteria bacterium]
MKPVELAFRPVDNQRLANLCGALDENLRQIETALDVAIARRGECFAVTGKPIQARIAAQVLQSFYERAKSTLSLEDVQLGLIEAAGPGKAKAP